MSRRDVEMARQISVVARELGLSADPTAVQTMLIVPGAPDIAAIVPFWRAVLGYEPRPDSPDEDLVDPRTRLPSFWFESMEQPRPDGGGAIHLAVWVPIEQAEARVAAALRPAATSSATTSPRCGGRSPMPPETKRMSPP